MSALQIFLIGAPRSGKTTVFEALTNTPEGRHFASKGAHHMGTVAVPDPRLEGLRDLCKPRKWTPAEITFVDVAIPPAPEGQSALSSLTPLLAAADALVIVVQAFGEMDYRGRPLDSVGQFESVLLELVVADLEKTETRLERIEHERRRGAKVNEAEAALLQRLKAVLEAGQPLRTLAFSPDEEKMLRTYQFLSLKPLLVVANVSEDRLSDEKALSPIRDAAAHRGLECLAFCAPLEAEIARLAPEEQNDFLRDYGLSEPARARLIQASLRAMNLICFFTIDHDEVRAWPVRKGTSALEAAGKIHSDMARGFIRAEVVPCPVLLREGTVARCREKGFLKVEGKGYEVQDGDVLHVKFNV